MVLLCHRDLIGHGDRLGELGELRLATRAALESLRSEGIADVLVEGGGRVFSSLLDEGLWDVMHIFVSPALFGPDGVAAADRRIEGGRVGAVPVHTTRMSQDVLMSYINRETMTELLARLA